MGQDSSLFIAWCAPHSSQSHFALGNYECSNKYSFHRSALHVGKFLISRQTDYSNLIYFNITFTQRYEICIDTSTGKILLFTNFKFNLKWQLLNVVAVFSFKIKSPPSLQNNKGFWSNLSVLHNVWKLWSSCECIVTRLFEKAYLELPTRYQYEVWMTWDEKLLSFI